MALTNVDFDKLIVDTVDMVTLFDKTDDSVLFMADQVTDGTIECGSEIVYGTGKAGVKLSSLDRSKSSKFTFNNGYVITNALASQIGATIETASSENKFSVPHLQMITLTSATSCELEFTPVGTLAKEIPFIYRANADKTQGEKYPIAAVASETEFKLDVGTKTITLPTGKFQIGDTVIVPYRREATVAKKMINKGDQFSKTARAVIDVICRDICDQSRIFHAIFEYGNAKLDGNFSMSFGNEPMKHALALEAMLDICSTNKELWTFYIA